MKNIKLTELQLRSLNIVIDHFESACKSGCAFIEMQKSDKDCDECKFPKAIEQIKEKLK